MSLPEDSENQNQRQPRSLGSGREWLAREMWPETPPADLRDVVPELLAMAPPELWEEREQIEASSDPIAEPLPEEDQESSISNSSSSSRASDPYQRAADRLGLSVDEVHALA